MDELAASLSVGESNEAYGEGNSLCDYLSMPTALYTQSQC